MTGRRSGSAGSMSADSSDVRLDVVWSSVLVAILFVGWLKLYVCSYDSIAD